MSRVDQVLRKYGVAAMLTAASVVAMAASAQAATPTAPSAAPKPASSATAKKRVVSPYARAASQRERAGQAPMGHAPTMVQGMGKPRKPHTGAPPK
jgi:predicted lipoprotein